MAQILNAENASATLPPPVPKRGRGRPRNQTPAEAATFNPEPDEPLEFEAEAGSEVDQADSGKDQEFFSWLSQWTTDEWSNMIAYLYRCEPVINRRSGGRATNLRKFSAYFDADEVMKTEGSGVYRVDVCRRSTSGQYLRVRQHYFDIVNLDYPPRIPPGDWTEEPTNKNWEWAKTAVQNNTTANGMGTTNPAQVVDAFVSGMERLDARRSNPADSSMTAVMGLVQTLITQGKPAGPSMQELIALGQALAPKQADNGLKEIIEMMREEKRDLVKKMEKLEERLNAPAKSATEIFKETLDAVSEVRGLLPRATGAATGTDWGEILGKVVDSLPTLVGAFARGMQGPPIQNAGGFQMPARAAAPPPAAPPQQQAPGAAAAPPAAAPPQQQQQTQEGQLPHELQERFQTIISKHQNLIFGVAEHMIDAFKNETGYDFRDWFLERKGMNVWREFMNDCGGPAQAPEVLTALAQLHDYLRENLAPPQTLQQFFNEFFCEPGAEPPGAFEEDDKNTGTITEITQADQVKH